jgi:anti-sigma factor RsiW
MSGHWNEELVSRFIDGDVGNDEHLRECVRCANAVIAAQQMKRAVRAAATRFEVPERLRERIALQQQRAQPRRAGWLLPVAAVVALMMIGGAALLEARRDAARELVDLHTTIVGSANPIDVVSTDRHTVKPWFEGKVPFAVEVPELAGTPFRLAGGRLVYWRGRPAAYMRITKGAHRLSLIELDAGAMPRLGGIDSMTIDSWRANGLAFVAVGDLPAADLEALRRTLPR